jgi:hypothetical protein
LGDTPLHAAAAKGRLDCLQRLIEAGANVRAKNRQGKMPVDVAMPTKPECGALLRTTMAAVGDQAEEDFLDGDDDEAEEEMGSQG